jgi:hypothetical protein
LLNQFHAAITQGTVPETSGSDNLWTLAMLKAAVVSQQQARKVQIDEVYTSELKSRVEFSTT